MSKIYNESTILCSCNGNDISKIRAESVHHLSKLYFCPSCQVHKCSDCCSFNIEAKYCSNCLNNYSSNESHCTKNCFCCPVCTSTLAISVSDKIAEERHGKIFKFKCLYCQYNYQTSLILKPRSLTNIIKHEKKQFDEFTKIYSSFNENLINRKKLSNLMNMEQLLSDDILEKLDKLNLSNLTKFNEMDITLKRVKSNKSIEIDETIDFEKSKEISSIKKLSDFIPMNQQLINNSLYNKHISQNFPLPKTLTAKKSLKCSQCNNCLLLPSVESIKFNIKWNAIDFMPTLKISNLINKSPIKTFKIDESYNFSVNFVNPLDKDMNVSISTIPELPPHFISSSSNYKINVTLPTSNFTIKSRYNPKNLIKAIPTSLLTSNTTLSRSELMLRVGSRLHNKYIDDDNMYSLVDEGDNWYSVPINILIESTSNLTVDDEIEIKIPLYMTVNSDLPNSIKALNLSKDKLSFGYWNIVKLGKFKTEV